MAIDKGTFETLTPSRFITFTFPQPSRPSSTHHHPIPNANLLRVAVADSPLPPADPPRVAAMIVPDHRESDWIFSTESGHFQLLLNSPDISRLVLVGAVPGTDPSPTYDRPVRIDSERQLEFEESLRPLLIALCPKSLLNSGVLEIPFVVYEDNVIKSVLLECCIGPFAGEMLVEDVQMECDGQGREFRRRLRFKRMPNLVQTEVRIVPCSSREGEPVIVEEGEFQLDMGVLVHPYLPPMVATLCLIGNFVDECVRSGIRPRALCTGVGGGALLAFLNAHLGFEVVGVEEDEAVLRVARQYFGLEDGDHLQLLVGDGMEYLEKITKHCYVRFNDASSSEKFDGLYRKYDVIMVDLDSADARTGVSAPPLDFVRKPILLAVKMALSEHGILVLNVIPPSRSCYEILLHEFRAIFQELYEIDVINEDNFVLVATSSTIGIGTSINKSSCIFVSKLKQVIPHKYMDSIRKL